MVAVSSRAQRLGGVNFQDPNFETTTYDPWKTYAQSKSANVLFAVELDRLAKAQGVRAFAVHPGLIPSTGIGRYASGKNARASLLHKAMTGAMNKLNIIKLINLTKKDPSEKFKSIKQGAATSIWCATSDSLREMGGVYCEDSNIAIAVSGKTLESHGVCPWAIDTDYAQKLWLLSEKLTGVKFEI